MKLSEYVILSQAPGGTDGFAYSYDDLNVASKTVYYYWLEDVDLSGTVTRHGLVLATAGSVPTAITLTTLQANSYRTNLSVLILGPFGVMAVLVLIKRRNTK